VYVAFVAASAQRAKERMFPAEKLRTLAR